MGAIQYPMRQTMQANFLYERADWIMVHKFARNDDLDTADGEVLVWDVGTTYQYQTTAVPIEVVSTDAADTAAGTGAQTVKVSGLDADWNLVDETVSMNGVTPVALSTNMVRVYRAIVTTAGSGDTNAGDITVEVVAGSVPLCRIPAGEGSTLLGTYTIPEGYDGFLVMWDVKTNTQAGSEIIARLRTRDNAAGEPFRSRAIRGIHRDDAYIGPFDPYPMKLTPRTDIAITSITPVNNSTITAQFQVLLVPQ